MRLRAVDDSVLSCQLPSFSVLWNKTGDQNQKCAIAIHFFDIFVPYKMQDRMKFVGLRSMKTPSGLSVALKYSQPIVWKL